MILINEIFQSISGEAGHPDFLQGTFCSFIRFQGCNFNEIGGCKWCDTWGALNKNKGKDMEIAEIVQAVSSTKNIVITGGEPQAQQFGLSALVRNLTHIGKKIQIETNGSYMPVNFGVNVTWVMDYKLPSSAMNNRMLSILSFYDAIKKGNTAIKFVFEDQKDIEMLLEKMHLLIEMANLHRLNFLYAPFILSPTEKGRKFSQELVEKIFEAQMHEYCVFSLQSHKILDLK